ncbi:MAG: hypothetical protein ACREQ5_36805, partial [Candidatus Dormibacteria bacterium]
MVNVSEGRDVTVLDQIYEAGQGLVLDRQSDGAHHRSVFTLAGPAEPLADAVRSVARAVVEFVSL